MRLLHARLEACLHAKTELSLLSSEASGELCGLTMSVRFCTLTCFCLKRLFMYLRALSEPLHLTVSCILS